MPLTPDNTALGIAVVEVTQVDDNLGEVCLADYRFNSMRVLVKSFCIFYHF